MKLMHPFDAARTLLVQVTVQELTMLNVYAQAVQDKACPLSGLPLWQTKTSI